MPPLDPALVNAINFVSTIMISYTLRIPCSDFYLPVSYMNYFSTNFSYLQICERIHAWCDC